MDKLSNTMLDAKKILSENLTRLLATRDESRLDLSRRIGVADGSLGRIKYGTGNPTLENLERIASFFRLEVWHLLIPNLDPKNPPSIPADGGGDEKILPRINVADYARVPKAEREEVQTLIDMKVLRHQDKRPETKARA